MRMLVVTASGGSCSERAHTGPPVSANSALTPTARNSVLLPDMFEPVTSSTVPAGPTSTSLATRTWSDSSGCPTAVPRRSAGQRGIDLGKTPLRDCQTPGRPAN